MAPAGGIWRHAEQLPAVRAEHRVTLGEGRTPLILAPRLAEAAGIRTLYLKLECQNPTGSFKDRGMALAISRAVAAGATHIVEDSSGNAGASAAAYAARAALRCSIYAPATAPAAKLRQAEACGAQVERVAGSREQVTLAALRAARTKNVFHVNHNASELFAAGMQTLAWELADELDHVTPIVVPAGGGSLVAGCFDGFSTLVRGRQPATVPPLFAVQSTACAPLVAAMENGWDRTQRVEAGPTVAGGITIADPPRGAVLLHALRASFGAAVAVDDEAIIRWGKLLARLEGVYAEPTSAAAVAGLAKLVALRLLPADGAAVVVITGSGLKDPDRSARP